MRAKRKRGGLQRQPCAEAGEGGRKDVVGQCVLRVRVREQNLGDGLCRRTNTLCSGREALLRKEGERMTEEEEEVSMLLRREKTKQPPSDFLRRRSALKSKELPFLKKHKRERKQETDKTKKDRRIETPVSRRCIYAYTQEDSPQAEGDRRLPSRPVSTLLPLIHVELLLLLSSS